MKKFISILLVLCMALTFLSGCANRAEDANEDAPIPYAWKEQRDGSYKFTITGETPEGSTWNTSYTEAMVSVDDPVTKKNGTISYKITAVGTGSSVITFSLTSTDGTEHVSYTISLNTNYDNGVFSITDGGFEERSAMDVVGTNTEYQLSYEKLSDYQAAFYIPNAQLDEWEADVEGESFKVSDAIALEGYTAFVVTFGGSDSTSQSETEITEETLTDATIDESMMIGLEIEEETEEGTEVTEEEEEQDTSPYEPTEEELAAQVDEIFDCTLTLSLYSGNISYKIHLTCSYETGFQVESVKQGTYEKETPPYAGASLRTDPETGDVYLDSDGSYDETRPQPDEVEDEIEGENIEETDGGVVQ